MPSTFNARTFQTSGVIRPIHVLPLGVNPNYFNPQILEFRASSFYTFLSVFEWGERKAPEILLRAYVKVFSAQNDVLLILNVFSRDPGVDFKSQMTNLPPDGTPVALLFNQEIPSHQLGCLYRSADCFVLPARGEGWGMPILKAMVCGLPAIATEWSAQMDFMNEQNSYLLRVIQLVAAIAKCPYYTGFRWAEPEEDHLVHLLRYVYTYQIKALEKGTQAAQNALTQWTWRHVVEKIKAHLLESTQE